jgi:hypothetical protein
MCIISGPVQSVNSTKLLALPSRNKQRQLTVYSNSVITPNSNAMCLPVPTPETVRFERVPKDIFEQCSKSFRKSMTRGGPILSLGNHTKSRVPLQIQSHGSYDVVLVPSIDDIDRVPPKFTVLSNEVIEFLKASYPSHFGIVLCRLKKGATNYEPFAYSHAMQANKQLFYPTKHFHTMDNRYSSNNTYSEDEEPGWASGFGNTMLGVAFELPGRQMPKVNSTRVADDWDHEIYSAFTPEWCHSSKNKEMTNTNRIDWSQMPRDFQFDANIQLRCKEIVGEERNIDIEMPV